MRWKKSRDAMAEAEKKPKEAWLEPEKCENRQEEEATASESTQTKVE